MPGPGPTLRRPHGSPWVSLGGDALKALLSAPTVAKTAHFVLHAAPQGPVAQELPTGVAPDKTASVDNLVFPKTTAPQPTALALVVPKRHAKRAATRNLVKRQMREAMRRRCADWAGRQMLIRQRSPFSPLQYLSASSAVLRNAVRGELEQLFAQAKR